MKISFSISNFLEAISSLSHSVVFLYFIALMAEEAFLICPCLLNLTTNSSEECLWADHALFEQLL